MDALRFYGVRDIRFEEAPEPIIETDSEVKIKVKAVGICGSDIHRYALLGPYVPGTVWGHEFSGEVVAVGKNVKDGPALVMMGPGLWRAKVLKRFACLKGLG